ncbi:MAG TPA: uL15m family ribosomal protein [Methanospirillum sp.]|jgi:large subunit ribosomal protein L15|uniref:uL15m family ribosomal protein n=1 Tax=Methanospirillum sp. TaxID=45200 RepID=UPI0009C53DBF|nr:uL15m family ribosomal protein [Methanospirillum sp.]OQB38510.1 MAG: 50S ribosomal protein L15P [Euryarchaeota archaeon ADurb.Bin165]HPY59263.1 uL15m family ribosomal protein [Methanospirillum sp.]
MPVNKRSKYRGSRTCGGGTHKNRRGAGNRGGRGRGGSRDHKFVRGVVHANWTYGTCGFKHHHRSSSTSNVLDIGHIDLILPSLIEQGTATLDGDVIVLNAADIGIEKVLGGGQVTSKMNITAEAFSQSAIQKIEAKGGHALLS